MEEEKAQDPMEEMEKFVASMRSVIAVSREVIPPDQVEAIVRTTLVSSAMTSGVDEEDLETVVDMILDEECPVSEFVQFRQLVAARQEGKS